MQLVNTVPLCAVIGTMANYSLTLCYLIEEDEAQLNLTKFVLVEVHSDQKRDQTDQSMMRFDSKDSPLKVNASARA